MIGRSQVAAVLVTRGDVEMRSIRASLPFAQIAVWNNRLHTDVGVYGRYAAIGKTTAPVILTQDDDVLLPAATIAALLEAYEPGHVVCNVPERFRARYHDSGLVGFGAIFDRDLPEQAFERFRLKSGLAQNEDFTRTCDIVFTMLTPMLHLDLPYTELAHANGDNRMWKQPDHFEERERMRELCRKVRDTI